MANIDEMLVNGIIHLLGKSIDAEKNVRMEIERQYGMTERVREVERARTERYRISQQAQIMHHMIDANEKLYSKALEADHELHLEILKRLDKILNNTNEINEKLIGPCLSLMNLLNGCPNVSKLEEKQNIYNNLIEIKEQF